MRCVGLLPINFEITAAAEFRRKMSSLAHALVTALSMAFAMGWEILWADPRLCLSGRGSGGRDQGRDEPAPARFIAALDRDRDRTRGRVVILFLRRCGAGPIDLP